MLIGRVDDIDNGTVYGWAFDKSAPDHRVEIQVLWSEKEVYRGSAEKFRQDLQEGGFGDGHCAFEVVLGNVNFNDPITVIATSAQGNKTPLPKAELAERHLSRHFDSFSKEYRAVLSEFAKRLTALEARFERKARETAHRNDDDEIKKDILSIEKRLYETDVYITRIDERLKNLSDRQSISKPTLLSRLFGRK